MSFKIIVKLPSGVDVVLPAALGTPLECWEIKERALLKAPTTLRGIDLFELYEDAAGEVKVATEQAFLSAVTLYAKRIDVRVPAGTASAAGAGGDEGLVTRRDLAPFGDLLIDRVKQLLAGEEGASAVTPADYEEAARSFLCDVVLPQWLGLVPLAGALLARAAGDVHVEGHTDVQWDFRAPVRVSALPPSCPAARGASMVVYRGFPAYVRPDPPPIERYLTPTKVPGAAAPPDAHYMAIFEVTTTKKWSRGRESLLWRLETRLAVSLERAKAMQAEGATPLDITDVVAVVGVVGPFSCEESVNRLMARYDGGESAVPPNLRKLMDAARFIFVFQPFEDQIEGGRRAVNVAGGAGAAAGTPATGTPPS